jgi:hypothetical protein
MRVKGLGGSSELKVKRELLVAEYWGLRSFASLRMIECAGRATSRKCVLKRTAGRATALRLHSQTASQGITQAHSLELHRPFDVAQSEQE